MAISWDGLMAFCVRGCSSQDASAEGTTVGGWVCQLWLLLCSFPGEHGGLWLMYLVLSSRALLDSYLQRRIITLISLINTTITSNTKIMYIFNNEAHSKRELKAVLYKVLFSPRRELF